MTEQEQVKTPQTSLAEEVWALLARCPSVLRTKRQPKSSTRLLLLFGIFLGVVGADVWYRQWQPSFQITTAHYLIESTASPEYTKEIGHAVESLYEAYKREFGKTLRLSEPGRLLRLRLYGNQKEFHRCNRVLGYGEALYRSGICHAYYSSLEPSPWHWMLHEAVHQLNNEVAHLNLARWVDEGLADYYKSSVLTARGLEPGTIDRNTYPIW